MKLLLHLVGCHVRRTLWCAKVVKLVLATELRRLFRQPIQQRRQHVIRKVSFKLFNGPKMALAQWASGLNDLVLPAQKRIQIMAQYFFSDGAQKFRLLHDRSPTGAA